MGSSEPSVQDPCVAISSPAHATHYSALEKWRTVVIFLLKDSGKGGGVACMSAVPLELARNRFHTCFLLLNVLLSAFQATTGTTHHPPFNDIAC